MYYHGGIHDSQLNYVKASGVGMPTETPAFFYFMAYHEKLKDPRWQKKRLDILSRDEFTCQNCGEQTKPLNVHHIFYNGEPWEAKDCHLITYCEDCHKVETERLKIAISELPNKLKERLFSSESFFILPELFEKDRGWNNYYPAFDIVKMVIDDDELWDAISKEFWKREKEMYKQRFPDE